MGGSAVVPAGVLRGAAGAARLPAEAALLPGGCAAATAAGGRSEGDTVAPRRKPVHPQPGPRRGHPGCPSRLRLLRRPPPTPTCSADATQAESTAVPRGERSRTGRWGRGEQELRGGGSGNVPGSPRGEGRGTAKEAQRYPRGQTGSGHARHGRAGRPPRHVLPLHLPAENPLKVLGSTTATPTEVEVRYALGLRALPASVHSPPGCSSCRG